MVQRKIGRPMQCFEELVTQYQFEKKYVLEHFEVDNFHEIPIDEMRDALAYAQKIRLKRYRAPVWVPLCGNACRCLSRDCENDTK